MSKWRNFSVLTVIICGGILAGLNSQASPNDAKTNKPIIQHAIERGRSIWFNSFYGNDGFFAFLANHPDPSKRVNVAFDKVVNTPRQQRFQTWGTINDPDCRKNPQGGPDICPDPEASGVIGIRKVKDPATGQARYGISCASCHAGFDPLNPPHNVNEPKWSNIHPSIGNQFLNSGKIFAANLAANDPRGLMFNAWPLGSVDTTLLFNDNIMNPGVITAFWNLRHRPTFKVGLSEPKIRAGQGGEDDLGGDIAALRVYTNIGVCFRECVAGPVQAGVPIDINACRQSCPQFPSQKDMDDLVAFLKSIRSPRYPNRAEIHWDDYRHGKKVFEQNCASCHSDRHGAQKILSNDQVNPLVADTANATNTCRARTTNWEAGRIWAQFSSDVYKTRVTQGNRGYRTMPLVGIWATAPLLHNQSIGDWAPADASPKERGINFENAMRILLSPERTPKVNTLPVPVGPFPPGTPLTVVFSRDPASGALLCDDALENRGHYYGSQLVNRDKEDLIHWLKFQ